MGAAALNGFVVGRRMGKDGCAGSVIYYQLDGQFHAAEVIRTHPKKKHWYSCLFSDGQTLWVSRLSPISDSKPI
jgi:hypothetical protein